jgi:hypothetical protein
MSAKKYTHVLLLLASGLYSCEMVINPDLESADPVFVVDAWITNAPAPQVVRLMKSQPYFDKSLPPGVTGASVMIQGSDGSSYTFTEDAGEKGKYVWTPAPGITFGEAGREYTLTINAGGETLTSTTRMGSVPPIDSITFSFEPGNDLVADWYLAEFWAVDLPEFGNTYWIKSYQNDTLLNKPSELNLAYDAAFSKSGAFSGVTFIAPIRTGINPFDQDSRGNIVSPFEVGDSVYVEVHSLSEASFTFLTQVAIQTDRTGGFAELFATPLANVSTNITNVNSSGTKAVGFFNVASVSGLGRKFKSLEDVSDN